MLRVDDIDAADFAVLDHELDSIAMNHQEATIPLKELLTGVLTRYVSRLFKGHSDMDRAKRIHRKTRRRELSRSGNRRTRQ